MKRREGYAEGGRMNEEGMEEEGWAGRRNIEGGRSGGRYRCRRK